MTDSYKELIAYADAMTWYLRGIVALFVIALIATLCFLFWPFKEEGDEE